MLLKLILVAIIVIFVFYKGDLQHTTMRIFGFITFLVCYSIGLAQTPAEELAKYKKEFPDDSRIFILKKEVATINIKNGELEVSKKTYEEMMYLDNKILDAKKTLEYSSFTSFEDIKAYTLTPTEKKYKTIKVKEFKTKDVIENDIFYNDIKEISFNYPSLTTGAKKVIDYNEIYKEPRFLTGYFWGNFVPTLHSEYIIDVDKNVNIENKFFNCENIDLEYTKTEEGNRVIHKWVLKNGGKIKFEDNAPSVRYFAPHMISYIKSYAVNDQWIDVLNGVKGLHNWYSGLIKDINKDDQSALKILADSITMNISTEKEKVKAIYYWVQDNIKYVAFEDGLGGFIPRNASKICDKRFGDCKDMANIIVTLLSQIDIEAHLVWIGTYDIPYSYKDVPTPSVDNHMIACYISKDNEHIFLDATGRFTPFGSPSSFIQGKEAMINMANGEFKLFKVPIVESKKNIIIDSIQLKFNDKNISGKGKSYYSGFTKVNMASQLEYLNPKEKEDYFNGALRKGNNKCLITNVVQQNISNRDKNIELKYDIKIEDYVNVNDDEIYINLNLEKIMSEDLLKTDRKLPFMRQYAINREFYTEIEIPEGYKIAHLPNNNADTYEKFGFEIKYITENQKLIQKTTIDQNFIFLYENDFEKWNQMVKKLRLSYNEVVTLKKK